MTQDFLVRDTRQPGHFWADNELIDIYGPRIGPHGLAVYMALARRAINGTGECKLSMRTIAAQIAMSVGGVSNAMTVLLELGLARVIDRGDNRRPAVYILADVKAMTDPGYAQLRLTGSETSKAKALQNSVHPMNAGVHPLNATVHPVNSAFTTRTRNKERKTSSRLDLKTSPNPSVPEGTLKIPTRKRDQLKLDQEIRRLVKSSDCPLQGKLVVIQAAVNLGFDPQYVNYVGGSDCPFHPNNQSVTQNGNCWACYSEQHESGCQLA